MSETNAIDPVAVVPNHNHHETIGGLSADLLSHDLPVIVVDDGSNRRTREVLDGLEESHGDLRVVRRPENGGKGAAVMTGLACAEESGYSHAVQIDADRQHDPSDVPKFLAAARARPDALILGEPTFDDSIPAGRYYGRFISRFWVWVETLSTDIADPLFGFRCYPVRRTMEIVRREPLGTGMDFDPEIAVRFCWDGGGIVNVRTPVRYNPDGLSNFDLIRDNLDISWMHCQLFFGMLGRIPTLLRRRRRRGRTGRLPEEERTSR